MHGAIMKRDIRRTGVAVTIKGKPNPDYRRHLPKLPIDLSGISDDERAKLERVAESRVLPSVTVSEPETADGPTRSRLAKAENHYAKGDDKRGNVVYTMRDDPLGRMLARSLITAGEYSALQKYHHHWHCAGLEMGVGSMDLNRVFSNDPGSMSGMAKTEGQAHHRNQWRAARNLVGHKTGIVVDNVVCAGTSLEIGGYALGYNSPFRAREAALKHIQRAADMLRRHWGLS